MRAVVALSVALAAAPGCRDRSPPPAIHADPAPSSTVDAAHPNVVSVRRVELVTQGTFEMRLTYPHVDLPSSAGEKISATLEDAERTHANELRDRWTSTMPHATNALYWLQCTPTVVAQRVVSVKCRGSLHDEGSSMEARSYVWIVEGDEPRRLTIDDVVGTSKLPALAAPVGSQLTKQTAKPGVLPPADLVARRTLDCWSVQREGIAFDFLPGVASPVQDELYAGIDWPTLHALALDTKIVDTMKAAIGAPDTLFGYPLDAGTP